MNTIDAISQPNIANNSFLPGYAGFGGPIWGLKYRKRLKFYNEYSESNGYKNRRKPRKSTFRVGHFSNQSRKKYHIFNKLPKLLIPEYSL